MSISNRNLQTAVTAILGSAFVISGCTGPSRVSAIKNPNILCSYEKSSISIPGVGTFSFKVRAEHNFLWREAESVILADHEHTRGVIEKIAVAKNNNTIEFSQGYPSKSYFINLETGDFSKTSHITNQTFEGWSAGVQGKCRII